MSEIKPWHKRANKEYRSKVLRNWKLQREYGITQEDYDRMLDEQGGVCAICGQPEKIKKRKYLSVDHDHNTGRVRGLLCFKCNVNVGVIEKHFDRISKYLGK